MRMHKNILYANKCLTNGSDWYILRVSPRKTMPGTEEESLLIILSRREKHFVVLPPLRSVSLLSTHRGSQQPINTKLFRQYVLRNWFACQKQVLRYAGTDSRFELNTKNSTTISKLWVRGYLFVPVVSQDIETGLNRAGEIECFLTGKITGHAVCSLVVWPLFF